MVKKYLKVNDMQIVSSIKRLDAWKFCIRCKLHALSVDWNTFISL